MSVHCWIKAWLRRVSHSRRVTILHHASQCRLLSIDVTHGFGIKLRLPARDKYSYNVSFFLLLLNCAQESLAESYVSSTCTHKINVSSNSETVAVLSPDSHLMAMLLCCVRNIISV